MRMRALPARALGLYLSLSLLLGVASTAQADVEWRPVFTRDLSQISKSKSTKPIRVKTKVSKSPHKILARAKNPGSIRTYVASSQDVQAYTTCDKAFDSLDELLLSKIDAERIAADWSIYCIDRGTPVVELGYTIDIEAFREVDVAAVQAFLATYNRLIFWNHTIEFGEVFTALAHASYQFSDIQGEQLVSTPLYASNKDILFATGMGFYDYAQQSAAILVRAMMGDFLSWMASEFSRYEADYLSSTILPMSNYIRLTLNQQFITLDRRLINAPFELYATRDCRRTKSRSGSKCLQD